MLKIFVSAFLFFQTISSFTITNETAFRLHIIHINDFHARFEETNRLSGTCTSDCIGGFSRIYSAVKHQMKKFPNSIVLNAGDNFQGTIWYNVYKWNVTQHFMNKIPFDAFTLGNHEFDDGIAGVVPFIKALHAPTVVSNIDDSQEPDFQNIYKKSVVVVRDGIRIGIIGVLTSTANTISSTGRLKLLNESEAVNKEADRLVARENVDTIIILCHCGYDIEKEIARQARPKITIIVGGHSHSFLYTGQRTPNKKIPVGPYPTVVKADSGHTVLVVQASAFTEFLGDITINYDNKGNAASWHGKPIYMDNKIPQDKKINKEILQWKQGLGENQNKIIGYSKVLLDSSMCELQECNFGNLIADAMVNACLDTNENGAWAYATIGIINSGGIRVPLPVGNITANDLLVALPFGDTMIVGEIKGKYIKEFLEQSVLPFKNSLINTRTNLLQLSGIHVIFNTTNPPGSKVECVKVLCRKCLIPTYEPLRIEENYRIVVNSFLARGGNGFSIISKNLINSKVSDVYTEALKKYIQIKSPIVQSIDGRIKFVSDEFCNSS